MFKILSWSVLTLGAVLVSACEKPAPQPQPPAADSPSAPRSLYQRLGGYDAIAAVTDDFLGRMLADTLTRQYFANVDSVRVRQIRQNIVDQICGVTGGPCYYTGMNMKTAHKGLKISEAAWNAAAAHLVETMDKFKLGQKEKDDVLGFVSAQKSDIVGQ